MSQACGMDRSSRVGINVFISHFARNNSVTDLFV
jgi:hypothetical protein